MMENWGGKRERLEKEERKSTFASLSICLLTYLPH